MRELTWLKEQNDEFVHLAGFVYISSAPKPLNKDSDANIRIKNESGKWLPYAVERIETE